MIPLPFPYSERGLAVYRVPEDGKWDAVQTRILVNMPKIHISIGRISYALHNLQFVIQILYMLPVIQFCTNLVLTNIKKMLHERHANNSSSCLRKSITIPGNSSLQVQQVYGGM